MTALLTVFAVAVAVAFDVFAMGVAVGMRGVTDGQKIRIGAAFAFAEVTMTVIGAAIGLLVGRLVGSAAGYVGCAALFALGIYMIYESRTGLAGKAWMDPSRGAGLVLASLAISMDSLGIGFSILYLGVPLPISLLAIGAVSIASTLLGLTLGASLGRSAERYAGLAGGVILAVTGIVFAAFKALHGG